MLRTSGGAAPCGRPAPSRSPRCHRGPKRKDSHDDSALLATQERLERLVAVGMARARDSVVALEYAAADGPADSRRVATGVVINTDGDVLSVRIDRPTSSQPAGPGGSADHSNGNSACADRGPRCSGHVTCAVGRRRPGKRPDPAANLAPHCSADQGRFRATCAGKPGGRDRQSIRPGPYRQPGTHSYTRGSTAP